MIASLYGGVKVRLTKQSNGKLLYENKNTEKQNQGKRGVFGLSLVMCQFGNVIYGVVWWVVGVVDWAFF